MTKILIVSDTHRHIAPVIELQRKNPHDVILHLGDHAVDGQALETHLHVPVLCVRGNCDPGDRAIPYERILEYHGLRLFLTHGHRYSVKTSVKRLAEKAKKEKCPVALYGHTHRLADERREGIHLLNPGAIYAPRGGESTVLSLLVKDTGLYTTTVLSV